MLMMEDGSGEKRAIDWFDQAVGYYREVYRCASSEAYRLDRRTAEVKQLLTDSGGKLLDVGCGIGMLFARLGSEPFEFFGTDLSHNMMAECKNQSTAVRPVHLAQSNLEHLPFADASFDVVVALGVLEYLSNVKIGIEEIARVTKPRGTVIVSMLNKRSLYCLWERYVYSKMLVQSKLAPTRRSLPVRLHLHSARALARILSVCQLEEVQIMYYDFSAVVPPFDERYPRRTRLVNARLERLFATSLSNLFATGFLVKARKAINVQPIALKST
jgi:ubiquinone/menaquinone biosynthesis C-methylase UbiE